MKRSGGGGSIRLICFLLGTQIYPTDTLFPWNYADKSGKSLSQKTMQPFGKKREEKSEWRVSGACVPWLSTSKLVWIEPFGLKFNPVLVSAAIAE